MRPSVKWGLRAGGSFLILVFALALVTLLVDVAKGDAEEGFESAVRLLAGSLGALSVGVVTMVGIEFVRLVVLIARYFQRTLGDTRP